MRSQFAFLAIAVLAANRQTSAQQLRLSRYPYDIFDLSAECVEALNTTVECSDLLGRHAGQVSLILDPLSEEALESVCTDECRSSLESLRKLVHEACDAKEDAMIFDHYAYPATFNLDRYLHVLDVSCIKDSDTGKFCDTLLNEWRNEANGPNAHDCHMCMLEAWRVQLESPIGYEKDWAEDFASVTESCSAFSYSYTVPPPYRTAMAPTGSEAIAPAGSAFSTPTAEPTPCATPYTIREGDSCGSIAAAQNVSFFGIIEENPKLDSFCHLPAAGTEICLPAQCRTHFLMMDDNCRTLEKRYNVTRAQLASWNSNLDPRGLFYERWQHTRVCVSEPGGELDLELPPNDIATDPGYEVEFPSISLTCPPSSTISAALHKDTLRPHAPGTLDSCVKYVNAINMTAMEEAFGYRPWYADLNRCTTFASLSKISMAELREWNPSLSDEECKFDHNYSYCVAGEQRSGLSDPYLYLQSV
ncbi:uncharacterized protein DNG_05632 [Cephalotrichum gorgonifer]|uniref:LysM domain-containing protein n=1 Tax=Cephalotrichum gorgonifer TaxID=2041049 RepID=A0AAE8SVQ2_9PEZI|nr:uncharacterized protein DNG_05632 [Cephalotrichum gorgonifer]